MGWFTREVLKNTEEIKKIMLEQIERDRVKDQQYIDEIKQIAKENA